MTVYLRPNPLTAPVKYATSIEGAGLVLAQNQAIAMYTARSTPNVGPAGNNGNSLLDTIIASASDESTAITVGGPKTTFRAPYELDLTLGYVRISLTNAPTGADFIVDVHMNGATIFSTLVRIDATELTSVSSAIPAVLSVTAIPDDAEFTVHVTQVGSTIAGTGLKVAVTGMKVEA
jgi:hypothetical protein